jgi:hypothetical protein
MAGSSLLTPELLELTDSVEKLFSGAEAIFRLN